MIEFEETEKTENGLDFLIRKGSEWKAWSYSKEFAEDVVSAINRDTALEHELAICINALHDFLNDYNQEGLVAVDVAMKCVAAIEATK